MSLSEKKALIDAITLRFAEDYSVNITEAKEKLNSILSNYHVSYANEPNIESPQSTEYLFAQFAKAKLSVGMKQKTLEQYKIAIDKLEFYANKKFADCENEDMNYFLIEYGKTVSPVTLKHKFLLLSSVYKFLHARNLIPYNPLIYCETPKNIVRYKTPLSEVQLECIKAACEAIPCQKESLRDMAMIYFFTSTGCRVGEMQNVKLGDIDFAKKTCIVMGKGKKQRPVILTDKALYRLQLYLETRSSLTEDSPLFARIRGPETRMTKDAIEDTVKKLRSISGVPNLTCHTFRRYYATELRRRNVPLQMIAASLGHANLNTISRYSLYTTNEMTDLIRSRL